ncbi:MAG: prolipoprotein diacylglyceryl transferase [Pseudomonadales bacterium]|jgi:phosphatidylglycerol:prolipoprotein diacylglycerol transferase|nr:prolipoprotein diacylglyceryl transferase [Pseudomonadales bacterium]
MLSYPDIDPVAIALGPLEIRWYGIAYLAAFACAWYVGLRRARRPGSGWDRDQVADLIFYGALGVVLGGRIGYVLFYQFERFLDDPLYLFAIREGGMSFHGGLIGVTLAAWWFGRRTGRSLLEMMDFVSPLVPIGLGLGRLGNFANGELPGRVTDVPWAFVFPGEVLARHPSSLYQAFTEGVVLFTLVALYSARPRPTGAVTGVFLAGYGILRFCTEFFRAPDAHLGFIAFGWVTMGQALCVPMVLLGLALLAWSRRSGDNPGSAPSRP